MTSGPTPELHLRKLARLRRVRARIDREYPNPLDVDALRRDAHMSAGHLSRQFRLAYGDPPCQVWSPAAHFLRHAPGHSRGTDSRHQAALGGHGRTPTSGDLSSAGPMRSRRDTRGHSIRTVRDREAPGSNPGPPTIVMSHDIVDTCCRSLCTGQRPPSGW